MRRRGPTVIRWAPPRGCAVPGRQKSGRRRPHGANAEIRVACRDGRARTLLAPVRSFAPLFGGPKAVPSSVASPAPPFRNSQPFILLVFSLPLEPGASA
ncbi:hypothetical protein U9M48_025772 [Paspalum notatum var. saurae]|uniref:Uncharacterized protein n=1 Tax=Paspalum notatum var. saurae TaxID=547442 RepID=A0AAQ3TR46_PASNO